MWLAFLVSQARTFVRAARPAGRPRRPARRRQARRLTIEQLEGRALLSSYSPFPGVVLGSVGAATSDTGRDAFLDHSGRIVVVGQTVTPGTAGERLAMFRFQSTGTPDPTFGSQGVVTTSLSNGDVYGLAVAPYASKTAGNPPDRILVGGQVVKYKGAQVLSDFVLARYNSNGTLDTTFGSKGIVQTDLGGPEHVVSILVQDDGRIVAAGESFQPGPYFALARYTAAGRLDTTFGKGGLVKTSLGRMQSAIWDQGKILMVGMDQQEQFALARYDLNGELDKTFNVTGIVTTSFDTGAGACGAAVYPKPENSSYPDEYEGFIVAAGGSGNNDGNNAVTLARYRPDGSLDTTFGIPGTGKVVTPNFLGTAAHVAIQSDGKILIGGSAREFKDESGNYLDGFMVARYNFDGTVDTTFGSGGIRVTPILNASTYPAWAGSMAVQAADGQIVLAGFAHEGTRNYFAVARYTADGTLDASFGGSSAALASAPASGASVAEIEPRQSEPTILVVAPVDQQSSAGTAEVDKVFSDLANTRHKRDAQDITFALDEIDLLPT